MTEANFDRETWRREIEESREEATEYFMHHFNWRGAHRPHDFTGPKWYPVSEEWRVPAKLERDAPSAGTHVQMQTSIGDLRDFDVYGVFTFTIKGSSHELTAYRMVPENPEYDELFVPFKDSTTGKETYGAGRYLDIPRQDDDDNYIIDFNLAYNPTCAYSPRYNCPYPPPQNTLKIPIEAGERIPFEHN
jgi:uncharacterized protein (DUF1684 family)